MTHEPATRDRTTACRICQAATEIVGSKQGAFAQRTFTLLHCPNCRFSFVQDPWLDYEQIYDKAYYEGRGADPLVDFEFELAEPQRTIRRYEWEGIVEVIGNLTTLEPRTRWLDFGCGNGGLVRHARANVGCDAVGFEQGAITEQVRAAGIPLLAAEQLAVMQGSFDVVTAIEVLEHVVDPLDVLSQIRRLLRPGGVFFYTTGNAKPAHARLLDWQYFTPEIHISLYEPATLDVALRRTGFEPRYRGYLPGWDRIIAFKVLKNLRRRTVSPLHGWLAWRALAPLVNARYGPYDFPVAYAV